MTTTLIIARHGNTFAPEDSPRRVGARTDLELAQSGLVQALGIGTWLKRENLCPDRVIAGPLKRTKNTAEIAVRVMYDDLKNAPEVEIDERLREVDYGPDENLEEKHVLDRIGGDALKKWDEEGIVPQGWNVDPDRLCKDWEDIAADILKKNRDQTVLIVTSNGVARFAPTITGDYKGFREHHNLKLATGAVGIFEHDGQSWQAHGWNIRPERELNA